MDTIRNKWLALVVLCLGDLIIVLDTTIVNVALPSIRTSLGFTETGLVWVINAYMLTFGGCLLLGGRLGDIFGYRRFFLWGIGLFTLASLMCGVAQSQSFLIVSRALQGIAGAVVSAVALSLIMTLFTEASERAKAMGVFGFVAAGGGAIGVFLGGLLTNLWSWHWIFLVNIPIGILVCLLALKVLPKDPAVAKGHLDIAGAVTITSSLMLFVYAIVNGNVAGWGSLQTVGLFGISGVLLLLFLWLESRVPSPLMPLHLFKIRNVAVANLVGVLWTAAMFGWFFISALYLQFVLDLTPFSVGLAFLPANAVMALFSLGVSAKMVMKIGVRATLGLGLLCAASGLALLARAPMQGNVLTDVVPSMVLLGMGAGVAFNPMLLAALSDVAPEESGVASGLVNTSFMMGGAVGLAILASIADAYTKGFVSAGMPSIEALNHGYHMAFGVATVFAILAALLGMLCLRSPEPSVGEDRRLH